MEAYRKRGWGFNNPGGIAQCEQEGFLSKLKVRCRIPDGTSDVLKSRMG